jgi:hypothetical protein
MERQVASLAAIIESLTGVGGGVKPGIFERWRRWAEEEIEN